MNVYEILFTHGRSAPTVVTITAYKPIEAWEMVKMLYPRQHCELYEVRIIKD